jgi:hypothetical protein
MSRLAELHDGGGVDLSYSSRRRVIVPTEYYEEIEEELTRPCHKCGGMMFETGFRKLKGRTYFMWQCQEEDCRAVATCGEGI